MMDNFLQNTLSGGTATMQLDKLQALIETRDRLVKEKETIARQLLEIHLNAVYKMAPLMAAHARQLTGSDMGLGPVVTEAYNLLRQKGYEFNYTIDPQYPPHVRIAEITKIP